MTARHPIMGLRIPRELKREFSEIAAQQNTTMSVLTRGLIEIFVKKHRKQNNATANH